MPGDVVPLSPSLRARLSRAGADVRRASTAAGLTDHDTVTTDQYFKFWHAIAESSPPDIGLRFATATQVHEYEVAQLAAFHSPDLRTALEKIARYKRFCGPKDMSIDTSTKEVAVYTTWLHASTDPPPRLIDASLASLLTLLQRDYARRGDPKKAAKALLAISRAPNPPRRLLLGTDALFIAKLSDEERRHDAETWRELSASTDFDGLEDFAHTELAKRVRRRA